MLWCIGGVLMIIAALLLWWRERAEQARRRASRAEVWGNVDLGWCWACPDGAVGHGYSNRAAAILAAETAGYWVAPDREGR